MVCVDFNIEIRKPRSGYDEIEAGISANSNVILMSFNAMEMFVTLASNPVPFG